MNTPGQTQARLEKRTITLIAGTLWVTSSLLIGTWIYTRATNTPVTTWNPVALTINLLSGHQTANQMIWLTVLATALTQLAIFGVIRRSRGRAKPKNQRGDEVARVTGQDITTLTTSSATAKAKRLGVDSPGLPVGISVRGGKPLYSNWEDVSTLIAGMRTGKTTSWVIPRILQTPGAVLVTSNKRDVVDATIRPRTKNGQTAWIFDPQQVVGNKPQTCWWNPLTFVKDPAHAIKLSNVLVDATREKNATSNAFFDNSARDLVAGLILAAALGNRPITEIFTWVNDDTDTTAQTILVRHHQPLWADRLEGIASLVPQTRSGVYGGASTMLQFLSNPENANWITPQHDIPEFQHEQFVTSTDTLYALSLEGGGSAAPILAALTVAVAEAALDQGAKSPGGRLAIPMLIELDEAANICPWRELPNQYSHFGSRGIVVDTILQSWSQGVEVWGEAGMKKLWGPANLSIYLGGSKEIPFLKDLSELIGDIWEDSINISTGRGGRSQSRSLDSQRRPLATISQLAALPLGRAWVFASGATPVLIQTQPWMTSPNAPDITQSIKQHAN